MSNDMHKTGLNFVFARKRKWAKSCCYKLKTPVPCAESLPCFLSRMEEELRGRNCSVSHDLDQRDALKRLLQTLYQRKTRKNDLG